MVNIAAGAGEATDISGKLIAVIAAVGAAAAGGAIAAVQAGGGNNGGDGYHDHPGHRLGRAPE